MSERTMSWPLGLGAGVCIHDNALDPALCEEIIQFFADRPYLQAPGQTFGGVQPETKLSTDSYVDGKRANLSPEDAEILSRMEQEVYTQYGAVLTEYIQTYPGLVYEWQNKVDTGYQYQRYDEGQGYYKPHIDGAPYSNGGAEKRVLASVLYLNTVEVGGGTRFEYLDYTCDAVVGRILTFPTTFLHLHAGLVPESSFKSIISTFVVAGQEQVS